MKLFLVLIALLVIVPARVYVFGQETEDAETTAAPSDEEPADENIEFDENGVPKLKPSPDADTYFLFTKPDGLTMELPSNKEVQFLVGFRNKGKQDFTVETLDASFRHPQDFTYHVQNFSALHPNRLVKPTHEATFAYSLIINEALNDRPFGFVVNLRYKDAAGKQFADAVFNQTVTIVELDEGLLNTETLFIYFFLASLVFGTLYAAYAFLFTKLRFIKGKKKKVETGTTQASDKIDYDWIPNNVNSKSPKSNSKPKKTKKDN